MRIFLNIALKIGTVSANPRFYRRFSGAARGADYTASAVTMTCAFRFGRKVRCHTNPLDGRENLVCNADARNDIQRRKDRQQVAGETRLLARYET